MTAREESDHPEDADDEETRTPESAQFLETMRAGRINEEDFLTQFTDEAEEESSEPITISGVNVDWQEVPLVQLAPLLADDGGAVPYSTSAGSLEQMPEDEPNPLPGKGQVTWQSLGDVVTELGNLESGLSLPSSPSALLTEIIDLRERLDGYVQHIPREGIRLFLAAPSVCAAAEDLVDRWVNFWRSMEGLRARTAEVGELLQIGRNLVLTDTRVVVQGASISAYVLPLHPVVLEPRVRAARLFREHPELDQDFFQIVSSAIDPAVPSIKLPVEGTDYDLAYSGQFRSLPRYERRAQQFHSPDVVRTLQDVIDRFVNVHPYSRRSLRVALVDPTAETAKQLLKWLANVDPDWRQRVALDAYVSRDSLEEIQLKLSEAEEELVSAEVASSRFTSSIERLTTVSGLHELISDSDRSPHILCLFDPAEVTQQATPIASLAPVLGSLVNEWEFGTRARRDATPYIRPRTGSTALSQYLAAQARLLGTDNIGTTERTPLLPTAVLNTLVSVAEDTTWIVVVQGASALVAPPSIGELQLLGRTSSGDHTAFVYSGTPVLVLEPVLGYLQQHAYVQADVDDLARFVLSTIRLALPEGLLGFFKRKGALSDESVLGRLGLAAVVAHLQETRPNPQELIVSLDTEGARRWLGLRESGKRADLIRFSFDNDSCNIDAIEIKARSGPFTWSSSTVPEVVLEALEQVHSIRDLLVRIFDEGDDELTASRREILKRQVFLEALHQWEPMRHEDAATYREQIRNLNKLFNVEMPVAVSERIFLVTPGDDRLEGSDGISSRVHDYVEVTQLGLGWFRSLLSRQPGGSIELDPELLDALQLDEASGALGEELDAEASASQADAPDTGLGVGRPVVSGVQASPEVAPPSSKEGDDEDRDGLLARLQASFVARSIPYMSLNAEESVIGPSVIQLPIRLEIGARAAQIEGQADDIARDMGVPAFRITNYPGRPGYALAEIPREHRTIPDVTSLTRPDLPYPAIALGAQLNFAPLWDCLDHIPHLLVAGKTGSGKSVLLRGILWQLTHLYGPEELDLVLIGPKASDYLDFADAPHFKSPDDVHLASDGAVDVLKNVVDDRYTVQQATFDELAREAMRSGTRVSNLRELLVHATVTEQLNPLRPFVVIVDEFVELMDANPSRRREFETYIARFSRLFRYIGGTMIAATQRPSVKVITGDIKANFRPLALRVERQADSRVILGESGAEQLIGAGDCLYKSDDGLVRLQAYSAIGTYLD
jgi:hypothetical protein